MRLPIPTVRQPPAMPARFGRWSAFVGEPPPPQRAKVACRCDCGTERAVGFQYLVSGKSLSCGCLNKTRVDISGKRYGKWLVIRYAGRGLKAPRRAFYECMCDCGKAAVVMRDSLVYGRSRSCGCAMALKNQPPRDASFRGRSARSAYANQRYKAKKRGIGWGFTFESWWLVWEQSGKWELRGKRKHQYCMARLGDRGPYRQDNVRITTNAENLGEYYSRELATHGRIRSSSERKAA